MKISVGWSKSCLLSPKIHTVHFLSLGTTIWEVLLQQGLRKSFAAMRFNGQAQWSCFFTFQQQHFPWEPGNDNSLPLWSWQEDTLHMLLQQAVVPVKQLAGNAKGSHGTEQGLCGPAVVSSQRLVLSHIKENPSWGILQYFALSSVILKIIPCYCTINTTHCQC